MSKTQYQDFGDGGASDSAAKLKELNLPDNMKGMRVLDLGCNAGFFCIEAAKRGATCVGIEAREDYHRDAENNAMKAGVHEQCEFLNMSWEDFILDHVGHEKFDYVLWLAAIHYEKRPTQMVNTLRYKHMNPGAKIVLDAGLSDSNLDPSDWVKLPRPGDMTSYPSRRMLSKVFEGFSLRRVARSTSLPSQGYRLIFHASVRKPNVVLVGGLGGAGKTELANQISRDAVRISSDSLLSMLDQEPEDTKTGFGKLAAEFHDKFGSMLDNQHDVIHSFRGERKEHFLDGLAYKVCYHINNDFDLYIVEGGLFTYPDFHYRVKKMLGSGFKVWSCVDV